MSLKTTQISLLSRLRNTEDDHAWAEFESRYRSLIFRYARHCGLSAADAEDVRQLTMMRLVRALPKFHYDPARGRFHDYLYRVVRSVITDFRRCPTAQSVNVQDEDGMRDLTLANLLVTPDTHWEQEWLDHHLRSALASVRGEVEVQSISVFEKLLAGCPVTEVAREFDISEEAVHKIKQRIRRRVQDVISRQIEEENRVD